MTILLDMDGVLVTVPSWRKVEIGPDGFMLFNEKAAKNLADILSKTNASIVLTTTHRINYNIEKWLEILAVRGLKLESITKVNSVGSISLMGSRASEIEEWVNNNALENYVIIDDDLSIENLPESIKSRWVKTNPMIGIDEQAKQAVLQILGAVNQ